MLAGAATGLQFSEGSVSECYTAITTSILATDSILDLTKKIYDPRKLPEILLINKDNTDAIAAITAYCNVDKLVNTLTKSLAEGGSTTVGRIGGGFIYEIPNYFNDYRSAENNYERGVALGKLIQIFGDWSI